MFRKITSITATLLLTAVVGSPALAEQITRAVSYHDLDLTQAAGVKTLHARVRRAATLVCRTAVPGSLLQTQVLGCRQEAMAAVKPQISRAIAVAERRAAESQFATR